MCLLINIVKDNRNEKGINLVAIAKDLKTSTENKHLLHKHYPLLSLKSLQI